MHTHMLIIYAVNFHFPFIYKEIKYKMIKNTYLSVRKPFNKNAKSFNDCKINVRKETWKFIETNF